MKRLAIITLFVAFLIPVCGSATDLTLRGVPVSVYFSPKGGCTQAVVDQIGNARKEVLVQAYSFTSVPIAQALLGAFKRGVRVEALLDKSQRSEKYTSATFLANSGVSTWIDDAHAIAHNKVIVIDRETVITGSFNFTQAAEKRNAENLLIIKDKALAEKYIKNWQDHAGHSEEYMRR